MGFGGLLAVNGNGDGEDGSNAEAEKAKPKFHDVVLGDSGKGGSQHLEGGTGEERVDTYPFDSSEKMNSWFGHKAEPDNQSAFTCFAWKSITVSQISN